MITPNITDSNEHDIMGDSLSQSPWMWWLFMLDIPRTTTSLGDRAFAVAGPRVSNSLPPAIRDPSLSPSIFGKLLKTYLFV